MKNRFFRAMALIFGFAVLPALAGAVDPAKSSITATFKQLGASVETQFKSFTAQIDYDPAHLAQAKALVEVSVASFDMGDAEYNKEVLKKEWLNAAQFPKATFTSTSIKSIGPSKLMVAGKLTIKGKTLDVNIPVSARQDGAAQVFEGAFPIKRLYFNIGEGEWQDTTMLADEVIVKFKAVKP